MEEESINETAEAQTLAPPKKKAKLFCGKTFRKQLLTSDKLTALKEFLELCKHNPDQIYEYFEKGGNCLELLNLLEKDTDLPKPLILEIVNLLLLQIVAKYPNLQTAAIEACRYLLNTHLNLINKLLGVTSNSKDRSTVLKLLTSLVTLSASLAKDILLHVNFSSINLEVLAKSNRDKSRNVFINFVISLLIDDDVSTLLLVTEKKLLASVIQKLQFDAADIVCIFLVTLKSEVLENPKVSKSLKMKIFNTLIVKEIINLYNWKGPRALNDKNKEMVSEVIKSQVSKTVHDFLLVLCTSHSLGVVFKNQNIGLGKNNNALMTTVLDGLEEPWKHSFAGELVQKICVTCPDLVKVMWNKLKLHLNPRGTSTWLKAVNFASKLVEELTPSCIVAEEMRVETLYRVIQSLIVPGSILKCIILDGFVYEQAVTSHFVLVLLVEMLKMVRQYLLKAREWLTLEDCSKLSCLMNSYLYEHFPKAKDVFKNWSKQDEGVESYTVPDHLDLILTCCDLYELLCPKLLETLDSINFEGFLQEINSVGVGGDSKIPALQVHAVKLFAKFEPTIFAPKQPLFDTTLSLVLDYYGLTKDREAKITLNLLLKNTGIFDDSAEEINVWVDAIRDEKADFVEIIKMTSKNLLEYLDLMAKHASFVEAKPELYQDIVASLETGIYESGLSVKHQQLSPLLLGALEYYSSNTVSSSYLDLVVVNLFHCQTNLTVVRDISLEEKYSRLLCQGVVSYIKAWGRKNNCKALRKTPLEAVERFSSSFLHGEITELCRTPEECLNQALFYFTNLSPEDLTHAYLTNCQKVVTLALQTDLDKSSFFAKILCNSKLLKGFSDWMGLRNAFLISVVEQLFKLDLAEPLAGCLKPYRKQLFEHLVTTLNEPATQANSAALELLEAFKLDSDQCETLICYSLTVKIDFTNAEYLQIYYRLLTAAFKLLLEAKPPGTLPNGAIRSFSSFLLILNTQTFDTSACSTLLHAYLKTRPLSLPEIKEDFFKSILFKAELCKDNVLLANYLFKNRPDFLNCFANNIEKVAKSKGLMLALLDAANAINVKNKILQRVYRQFEPTLTKSLHKPQKAGKYFVTYSEAAASLIAKCMPIEHCLPFVSKVQKYEVSELFHIEMLVAIFCKVVSDESATSEYLTNCILTLVHSTNVVFKKVLKSEESEQDKQLLSEISELTNKFCREVVKKQLKTRAVCENDAFQVYCKFCIKFGLSGIPSLVCTLKSFFELVEFNQDEGRLILDMVLSHSEFLEVLLHDDRGAKLEVLRLMLSLVERWPLLKQKNHVPIFLGAYHGTTKSSDRILLQLLQMYEKDCNETNFYDFKPFLWGASAITHYSIKNDIQKSLFRQPKVSEILENIQQTIVDNTITNYCTTSALIVQTDLEPNPDVEVYDLAFFLPLFNSILAPENQGNPYKFVQSGCLAMVVVALSSNDKDVRSAACHVLLRFHHQIEAKGNKKKQTLWVRYVEALCSGVGLLKDLKLSNLAAIFWARMTQILINPAHSLYLPLSSYLGTRETPNLSSVPELYTFLHFSSVNYMDVRTFILEVLRDGMRTEDDFNIASHAMAFKLIMELFSSCLSNVENKVLILGIIEKACGLSAGRNILCCRHGLLSWLYNVFVNLKSSDDALLTPLMNILLLLNGDAKNDQLVLIATLIDKSNCKTWLNQNDLTKFSKLFRLQD